MKKIISITALALYSLVSAQDFYARTWNNISIDVDNDGVNDFILGPSNRAIISLHNNAFVGVYPNNQSKCKALATTDIIGPNNTNFFWSANLNQGATIDTLDLSIPQYTDLHLSNGGYFTVMADNIKAYPIKIGSRYGYIALQVGYYFGYSYISMIDNRSVSITASTSSISENSTSSLLMYPNPSTGYLNLKVTKEGDYTILVKNSLGQVVQKSFNVTSLDLSQEPKGIYFVELEQQGQKNIQKISIK